MVSQEWNIVCNQFPFKKDLLVGFETDADVKWFTEKMMNLTEFPYRRFTFGMDVIQLSTTVLLFFMQFGNYVLELTLSYAGRDDPNPIVVASLYVFKYILEKCPNLLSLELKNPSLSLISQPWIFSYAERHYFKLYNLLSLTLDSHLNFYSVVNFRFLFYISVTGNAD